MSTISQRRILKDWAKRQEKLNPDGNSPDMQLLLDYAKGLASISLGTLAAILSCLLAGIAYGYSGPVAGMAVLIVSMIVLVVLALWNMAELFADREEP